MLIFHFKRNGINVDGATHKQVVDLIKSGGDYLILVVVSMPSDEVTRSFTSDPTHNNNNHSDDSSSSSANDYTDRLQLPINVPDFAEIRHPATGEKYIAFTVNLGSKRLCSKRYKEFDALHSLLKREFPDFTLPSFPKKWPFRLTDQQLEARRKALETYLSSVCSVRVIYETDLVRDFLQLPDTTSPAIEVSLRLNTGKKKIFNNSG